ncbi:hypothetical protein M408DRAFT_29664 [Serendipita vermifera MAFF 305830]|uniref:Uncharacterized protein n=1 Tax=Serendipita vermifera MAFF 305830 TaxID=933852 RepID=A0A0C2WV58_SERVB|nr:hypothetical protein M408DRAFT_29664 [Serendipita vermifera MAFF 305830]
MPSSHSLRQDNVFTAFGSQESHLDIAELLKRLMDTKRKSGHCVVASAMSLAAIFYHHRQLSQAIGVGQYALRQSEIVQGEDHLVTALVWLHLDTAVEKQSKWDQVEPVLLKVPAVVEVLVNQQRIERAELLQQGMVTRAAYFGRYHHRTIIDIETLSSIYTIQGLQTAADELKQELAEHGRQQFFRDLRIQLQSLIQHQLIRTIDEIHISVSAFYKPLYSMHTSVRICTVLAALTGFHIERIWQVLQPDVVVSLEMQGP